MSAYFLLPIAVVFIVITCPLLVDTSEVYCIGGCNNDGERNQQYEDICCNHDNLGDVVRLPSTGNSFKQKYIYCPSILPTGCGEYVGRSCADILSHNPSAVSGYYNITLNNGSSVSVYCDMEGANCNGEGGWTRVAYINPNEGCPYGLTPYTYSGNTYCRDYVYHYDYMATTITVMELSTLDIKYSQVCGEVRSGYINQATNMHFTTDDAQQHIWTFAIGSNENGTSSRDCPCNNGSQGGSTELFNETYVGNDYYCESRSGSWLSDIFWDGEVCNGRESTCCTNPMIPWFVKTLDEPTTDNIEWKVYDRDSYWYSSDYLYMKSLELMIK